MYETLAISAFHMSTTYPEKASLYLRESAALQAQALAIFTSTNHTIDRENIIPSFLFSSVLGLHFFCETFTSPRSDLNGFLDRLVQSIKLLRGVTAVIGDHWKDILNSDIRVLLAVEEAETIDRNDSITHAFSSLHRRLSLSSIITSIELEICSEALTKLLSVYNSQPRDQKARGAGYLGILFYSAKRQKEFLGCWGGRKGFVGCNRRISWRRLG
jgi:hypothetical protein